ncbi:hypothetical protein [Chitinivibrio alkaliphilus]|uniref:Outer membrane protein beta-barrel domain-containing protein n=1 Tax=Chitinivibrio alkaliphilus ACht1 TaxID=1313304 RepID=U7D8I9_9BACT|nr:hypothetical protein [Chitinivibrio alkaliphilus]ERP31397.1 hypothetical protein CALK_1747 [Chitinivibrio alkaliphilus ACht1]
MKLFALVLAVMCLLHISVSAKNIRSYAALSYSTVHPGGGRLSTVTSLQGGFVLRDRHTMAITGRYSLVPDDTETRRNSFTGEETHHMDLQIFGTAFFTYLYGRDLRSWLHVSGGISLGYQLTERDRQGDTSGIYTYHDGTDEHEGLLHLFYSAEGKHHSFGGPVVRIHGGSRKFRLGLEYRHNLGIQKNYGAYRIYGAEGVDHSVERIYFEEPPRKHRVQIGRKAGYAPPRGSSLKEGFSTLPQWTVYLLFFL